MHGLGAQTNYPNAGQASSERCSFTLAGYMHPSCLCARALASCSHTHMLAAEAAGDCIAAQQLEDSHVATPGEWGG